MSKENEILDAATSDLRNDDWATKPKPFVKPVVHVEGGIPAPAPADLSPETIIAISKLVEKQTRAAIKAEKFNPNAANQVISKENLPITDFSQLSMDSIYDLSVNIDAKEFMSADGLKIDLADSNYEARWVNKNPQRMGEMMGRGFTYICKEDLAPSKDTESIQTSLDASGHYSINDVVAMKIDKATYYRALRAAHLRALATTNQEGARKRAATQANEFMARESGHGLDYAQAQANRKMSFYDPDITV